MSIIAWGILLILSAFIWLGALELATDLSADGRHAAGAVIVGIGTSPMLFMLALI